jgi:hypothetical protein
MARRRLSLPQRRRGECSWGRRTGCCGIVGALGLGLTVSAPVALSFPRGLFALGSLDVLLPAVDFGLERRPLLPGGYTNSASADVVSRSLGAPSRVAPASCNLALGVKTSFSSSDMVGEIPVLPYRNGGFSYFPRWRGPGNFRPDSYPASRTVEKSGDES